MNPNGNPILVKHKDGTLRDKKFRLVNKRGYLIDPSGNVIDDRGKPMFDLCVLEEDGDRVPGEGVAGPRGGAGRRGRGWPPARMTGRRWATRGLT